MQALLNHPARSPGAIPPLARLSPEAMIGVPMTATAASSNSDRAFAQAVGQFLALARSANVSFDLVDNRVVMRAVNLKPRQWQPIRTLLDELGTARIEAFLKGTTDEERAELSAIAATHHPRAKAKAAR